MNKTFIIEYDVGLSYNSFRTVRAINAVEAVKVFKEMLANTIVEVWEANVTNWKDA